MSTVAYEHPNLQIRDSWPRGVDYFRPMTYRDEAGQPISLEDYPVLELRVQGPANSNPLVNNASATYDSSRGGALGGAVSIVIDEAMLETGWPESGQGAANVVNWTVTAKVSASATSGLPVFNALVTVFDTANR